MNREERVAVHKKQEKLQIDSGIPLIADLREGVPAIRSTDEGVVQYVRYNNVLYKSIFNKDTDVSATKLTDDGYLILPNGFILQWGQETAATGSETVTFPIPFPNECLNVTCTDYASGDTDGITSATGIKTLPTKTTVIFTCYSTVDTFFWQAIGY